MATNSNPILRAYSFDYKDKEIEYYLWIEEDWCSFDKLILKGEQYELSFNGYVCNRCHNSVDQLVYDLCGDCSELDTDFQIRLSCIFNREDALLRDGCTKERPSCKSMSNTKFCYQRYVLYLGRVGEHIKIGISRKYRKGGYLSRLIEQGLNEAIVIDSFPSLPDVANEEEWFREIGVHEKITGSQKIKSLEKQNLVNLEEVKKPMYDKTPSINIFNDSQLLKYNNLSCLWTDRLMREKYNDEKLLHFLIYNNISPVFGDLKVRENVFSGKVVHIQGSKIITKENGIHYVNEMSNLKHRELEGRTW